jgi:hypothetical protein
MSMRLAALAAIALAGCAQPVENYAAANDAAAHEAAAANRIPPPVAPPVQGTPGGLPDERTPVSEAPFAAASAQGAANVVQTYFALIEARRYAPARQLRRDDVDAEAFAAAFAAYADYHGQVGAPGELEGAAGSSYVAVPVTVYGRRRTGEAFRDTGTMTLRRVNDVDGATAEQRRWHIERSDVEPRFGP